MALPPISLQTARDALRYVSPDLPRDEWVTIGFALAAEFGGDGWPLFDSWSEGGQTYSARGAQSAWRSIMRSSGGAKSVTIATLIHEAQRNGFKFAREERDDEAARKEREQRRADALARAQAAEREREAAAARAAMESAARWHAASRSGSSAYLVRKLITRAEAIRFEADGTILVPMIRYDLPRDQALVGLQAIAPDGGKRFGRGTAKRGSACRLGCVVVEQPILVGEGYATAATLRAAVCYQLPVFVAFDAGNLEPVVTLLSEQHPQCPILVCADDDHATRGNPGRAMAERLRKSWKAHMIYPVWPSGPRGNKDTDFNDLQTAAGLHVVARQLRPALRALGYEGRLASEVEHAA